MKDERDVIGNSNYNPYGNPMVFIIGLILAILILVFVFGVTGRQVENISTEDDSDSHRPVLVLPA